MRTVLIALCASLAATSATAASKLIKPSQGYVYFHRSGADMATHDKAVGECVANAGKMLPLSGVGISNGIIGGMIEDGFQNRLSQVHFAANVENCMIANGVEGGPTRRR